MCTVNLIKAAHAAALARWNQPFPGFASGHDKRTSDQGLLTLLYGGLEHAARYDWQNAGRRLIDKTYVDMLWHVQSLTSLRSVRAEQIAAALDPFITDTVRPVWTDLPKLSHEQRLETSIVWTEHMAGHCFGSVNSDLAASRLMFFLFPMLPVFNLSRGHAMALEKVGHRPAHENYRALVQATEFAYGEHLPMLADLSRPHVSSSDSDQNVLIKKLLTETDWWTRRVFDEYLRGLILSGNTDTANLFGTDDSGKPTKPQACQVQDGK
jgi:hypothetical protein